MYELKAYVEIATKLFEELIIKYDIEVFHPHPHSIILKNEACKIEFTTGRYDFEFQVSLTTFFDNKEYLSYQLFEKENIKTKEVLTAEEINFQANLKDDVERYLYIYSIIFKRKLSKYFRTF
jgi:hypothetical protein